MEDTDIADLLEGLDKGFAFLMIAYIIVLFYAYYIRLMQRAILFG